MSREGSVQTSLTLLSRVQSDDQDAWSQFTRLYGPMVYSWCRNLGLPPDDVEDVGQDVFRVVLFLCFPRRGDGAMSYPCRLFLSAATAGSGRAGGRPG